MADVKHLSIDKLSRQNTISQVAVTKSRLRNSAGSSQSRQPGVGAVSGPGQRRSANQPATNTVTHDNASEIQNFTPPKTCVSAVATKPRPGVDPRRFSASVDRTAQYQQQRTKLMTQNFILIVVIAMIVIVYPLVVFPWLVYQSGRINSERYVAEEIVYQPQTPLINAPASYTSEASLPLAGYATPNSDVQFVLNGEALPAYRLRVGINGDFATILTLEEGSNTIQAYSFDPQSGLESALTDQFTVVLDRSTPQINLETPEQGQEFVGRLNQTIVVSGQTEPNARITVGSVAGTANSEGFFAVNYLLNEGDNLLEIRASDKADNEDKVLITVRYFP